MTAYGHHRGVARGEADGIPNAHSLRLEEHSSFNKLLGLWFLLGEFPAPLQEKG